MKKKYIVLFTLLLTITLLINPAINTVATPNVTVKIDGNVVSFPDQKPYIDSNNRTLVPMRAPMEAMGVNVNWDANKRQAILDKNNTKVIFTIGQKAYQVNGGNKIMDTQAIIVSGRTCIPIRYAAEAFGATVSWNGNTRTVLITTRPINSVVRPKAELDRQGWLSDEQSKYFRKELEKTIVIDKKNNTFSFYLPLLPEGFEWDIGFNYHYAPGMKDSHYVIGRERLADGKSYTFDNIRYNELDRGYFTFGPAKKGLVSADWTGLKLKTGEIEYFERAW